MADARLEIKAGRISFNGEGTEPWLAEQLDKVLAKLSEVKELSEDSSEADDEDDKSEQTRAKTGSQIKIGPLATYLKEKKATSNQSRKFLATAAWLQLGGMKRVATGDVTKALSTHNQSKLGNPSQCLNTNSTSGNIEKDGKRQFYVTDQGFEDLDK